MEESYFLERIPEPGRPRLLVICHTMARADEILRLWGEDMNFQELSVRLWTRKRREGFWDWDKVPMNQTVYDSLQQLGQKRCQNAWVILYLMTGTRNKPRPKLAPSATGRVSANLGAMRSGTG